MASLGNLSSKVKSFISKKTQPLLCKHDYRNNGQFWEQLEKKKWQLKNRKTCIHCNDDHLEIIGEK